MYLPQWTGSIEGYAKNYCVKNLWKFLPIGYDLEDLMQESYVVFLKCQLRYKAVDTPQHFMSLFKTALHNYMFDLSKPFFAESQHLVRSTEDFDLISFSSVEEEATLMLMVAQAPIEVKQVLNLLFKAPEELLDLIGFSDNKRGRSLVSCNRKLCALLGYDPRCVDLVGLVKSYFVV
jgi:hypothetical protein